MKLRRVDRDEMKGPEEVPAGEAPGVAEGAEPLSVSDLTEAIKGTLSARFPRVEVRGELSGLSVAGSGHRYFSLKDDRSVLSGVMWRSRTFDPAVTEGTEVIATGSITVYGPRGTYQLDCTSIRPVGAGDQAAAFEALKKKLAAEGLFDEERKRPIPRYPRRIGVVTSPTGAAIRDILDTLARRMPTVEVLVSPTRVQGTGAAAEIVRALNRFAPEEVDVIILGRGGGSAEDLQEFNDERLARAIAASEVPVISAVGHEVDFSIADFVADVRAATPTAAAELAVRDRSEILGGLDRVDTILRRNLRHTLSALVTQFRMLTASRGMNRPKDLVYQYAQTLDDLEHRGARALRERYRAADRELVGLEGSLRALDPSKVLARGYAMVEIDGEPVSSVETLTPERIVDIRLKDGSRRARIQNEEE